MREQVLVLHSLYTSAVFKELHLANVEFFFLGVPRFRGSGYMDGYAVRGFTRSCRNASFSAQHSFCTLFCGQSAALVLAAHLPEPSPATRVLSPRGHAHKWTIPNAFNFPLLIFLVRKTGKKCKKQ